MCILLHLSLKKAIERDISLYKESTRKNSILDLINQINATINHFQKKSKDHFFKTILFCLQILQNMLVFKMKNRTVYIQSHVFVYYNK